MSMEPKRNYRLGRRAAAALAALRSTGSAIGCGENCVFSTGRSRISNRIMRGLVDRGLATVSQAGVSKGVPVWVAKPASPNALAKLSGSWTPFDPSRSGPPRS